MAMNASKKLIDLLPQAVEIVNNRKHSRMKIAPVDITENNEKEIFNKFYNTPREFGIPKYKINDHVRVSQYLNDKFRKGYWPAFSPQIYKIIAINRKKPEVYRLEDHEGKILPRSYYQEELTAVKYKDLWLTSNIVQRRGSKVKVSWLGLPSSYDEWINASDVKDILKEKKKEKKN